MKEFDLKWLGMAVTAAVLCFAVPGATIVYAAEGDGNTAQKTAKSYDPDDYYDYEEKVKRDSDSGNDFIRAAALVAGAVVLYKILKPHYRRDDRNIHRPGPGYYRPGPGHGRPGPWYRYDEPGRGPGRGDDRHWRVEPGRRPGPRHPAPRPGPRPHMRDDRPHHRR
ncbi:hypothetical protein AGMMS50276_16490 [Synergistales bacterium]|nr:hypothetical protein AGMMS50276_16490 [Synergistales bacterium]